MEVLLYIILIIVIAIATGLFGGIIYLIYLPFKRRLIKSGNLTDKLNHQIKLAFILLLCMVAAVIYYFKDYGRMPSRERLENSSDVKLPPNFKVLKEEYKNMLQDHCILYYIQFENNTTKELIKSIQTSKFYNERSFYKVEWTEDCLIKNDSIKAEWSKSPKGFNFYGQLNGEADITSYSIELDTVTNILKYKECGFLWPTLK